MKLFIIANVVYACIAESSLGDESSVSSSASASCSAPSSSSDHSDSHSDKKRKSVTLSTNISGKSIKKMFKNMQAMEAEHKRNTAELVAHHDSEFGTFHSGGSSFNTSGAGHSSGTRVVRRRKSVTTTTTTYTR